MKVEFKNTKSILTILICLAYTGLYFSIVVSNITLFLMLAYCLFLIRPVDIIQCFRESRYMKIMIAIYILLIIGLSYSKNSDNGFFILEKKLSLLLIPLIVLPAAIKSGVEIKSLMEKIGLIALFSSVVFLIDATWKLLVLNDIYSFHFERFSSIHYVYYSIYFAVGALFVIDSAFDRFLNIKTRVWIITGLFIYSLVILILVASKTGIIAFGVASVLLLYRRIENKKILVAVLITLFLLAYALLSINETTRNRFTGLTEHLSVLLLDDFRGHEVPITDLNMRLLFWKISILHIWQDNAFMFGVGTGDAQDYINNLYALPQYNLIGYTNWDSHNQWVFTFIQLGLTGIAIMAVLYVRYIIQALKKENLKFLSFLLITLAFSFSESILESNKGIVFFALLFTLFCADDKKCQHIPDNGVS